MTVGVPVAVVVYMPVRMSVIMMMVMPSAHAQAAEE
jgi:hypothetical protein